MANKPAGNQPPWVTPDGHYFVVRGRLWRRSNPHLPAGLRATLTAELMQLRRLLRKDAEGDAASRRARRARLHEVKCALGERGAPWWGEDGPVVDRKLVANTPYAAAYDKEMGRPSR